MQSTTERYPLLVGAMGLFSSVIHVKDVDSLEVRRTLINIIPTWGFNFSYHQTTNGPPFEAPSEGLLYLVSPRLGAWSTILEGHCAVQNAPWLSDLARSLSAALATHTLALMVHDDDVLLYNLCHEGCDLDGYNSNPQYFETERLSNIQISEERHNPVSFTSLLPEGVSLNQLRAVLDRGWWSACNGERLDDDGLQPADESGFLFEGERMIAIGNLLELHGSNKSYPFAGWVDDPNIDWRRFDEVRFQRAHAK